jgi:hypothetical protein
MRRALISLLISVFSFPLIAPILLENTTSDLPSCCRRNGKHHCAMVDIAHREGLPADLSLQASGLKCPIFPKAGFVAVSSKTTVLSVSPRVGPPHFFRLAIHKNNENRPRIAFRGSAPKRGPPVIFDQTSNSLL